MAQYRRLVDTDRTAERNLVWTSAISVCRRNKGDSRPRHREKEHSLGWLDKLAGFSLWPYVIWPTLTTYVLQSIYIMILLEYENNSMEYLLFLNMNLLGLHVFHIF